MPGPRLGSGAPDESRSAGVLLADRAAGVAVSAFRTSRHLKNTRPVKGMDHRTGHLSRQERLLGIIIGTINRELADQAGAEATAELGEATLARIEANGVAEDALYLHRVLERQATFGPGVRRGD